MKLFNTLTGEHLDVSRVANGYEYVIKNEAERSSVRMNHEQYEKFLRKSEIERVEEEV
ncbi:hypothetical protein [Rahnella sp. AA]|uniref:hypothetical protein n=1 Tax=Rahnella sp. AA TaxID=2057180 RepID=UPI0012FEF3F0|nr:hypothetical protein [Rahnella sp. AA]